jgi:hypothetical protein
MGMGAWLSDLIAWWRGSKAEPPHPNWVRIVASLCFWLGLGFCLAAVLVGSSRNPSDPLLAVGVGLLVATSAVFLIGLFVGPGNRY